MAPSGVAGCLVDTELPRRLLMKGGASPPPGISRSTYVTRMEAKTERITRPVLFDFDHGSFSRWALRAALKISCCEAAMHTTLLEGQVEIEHSLARLDQVPRGTLNNAQHQAQRLAGEILVSQITPEIEIR